MPVTNGNRIFPYDRLIDPTVTITVTSYPKLLRSIARALNRTGPAWMGEALEKVAGRWNDDQAENIEILEEVLAHSNQLTAAQTSRIKAALERLQEGNDV